MRNNIYVYVAYRMTNPNPCGAEQNSRLSFSRLHITFWTAQAQTTPRVGYHHLILASAKLPTCHKLPQLQFELQLHWQLHGAPQCATCSAFVLVVLIYSGTGLIYRRCLPLPISVFLSLSLSLSLQRRVRPPVASSIRPVGGSLPEFVPPSPVSLASLLFNLANLYTPRCTVVRSCCYYLACCSQLVYYKQDHYIQESGRLHDTYD